MQNLYDKFKGSREFGVKSTYIKNKRINFLKNIFKFWKEREVLVQYENLSQSPLVSFLNEGIVHKRRDVYYLRQEYFDQHCSMFLKFASDCELHPAYVKTVNRPFKIFLCLFLYDQMYLDVYHDNEYTYVIFLD